MITKATRLLADGALITAFPLSGGEGTGGAVAGGYCPFEKMLLPGSRMEFLHAGLDADGFTEFSDIADPLTYAAEPDKRYKVKTFTGSVTVPDGNEFTPSDPPGNGFTTYYSRTTTDDRVITYSLDYSTNQTGWIIGTTGTRTTGDRSTHATVTEAEAAAEGWTPPATTTIAAVNTALTSAEGATVYSGAGITATISSEVVAADLKTWCEAKISDLKSKVDVVDSGVFTDLTLESYHRENLEIKIAVARMTWTGSGMFDPLPGKFSYFVSPMAPNYTLTAGNWKLAVSDVIPDGERYFDAAGMYGESTWWTSSHSLFGISVTDIASNVLSNLLAASYPNSGVGSGWWKNIHYRAVSLDGKKRKFEFRYKAADGGALITESLTTSAQDGFANATNYIQAFYEPSVIAAIKTIWTFDADDNPVVEYEIPEDGYTASTEIPAFLLFKHREKSSWGYQGFTHLIDPGDPEDPNAPPTPYPDPLDIFYKTITITSTGLKYAEKVSSSPPPFQTGMTATGEMSGSFTLAKPSEWKLGTIDTTGQWSKMTTEKASPFKLDWTAAGKSGSYEIGISGSSPGFVSVSNPPFYGFGDQIVITETEYKVNVPMPASADLPVREYRKTWPRIHASHQAAPTVVPKTFSLAAPEGAYGDENYTTLQKSGWTDLGLPEPGDSWTSEPGDEFSAFVGNA